MGMKPGIGITGSPMLVGGGVGLVFFVRPMWLAVVLYLCILMFLVSFFFIKFVPHGLKTAV